MSAADNLSPRQFNQFSFYDTLNVSPYKHVGLPKSESWGTNNSRQSRVARESRGIPSVEGVLRSYGTHDSRGGDRVAPGDRSRYLNSDVRQTGGAHRP